jgi:hypothetical protein
MAQFARYKPRSTNYATARVTDILCGGGSSSRHCRPALSEPDCRQQGARYSSLTKKQKTEISYGKLSISSSTGYPPDVFQQWTCKRVLV